MPDKNVQLPDGRIVAFPDTMADADISAVIKKQLNQPEAGVHPTDVRTIPNPRTRTNLPNPVEGMEDMSLPHVAYEGVKSGLTLGSLPTAAASPIPALRALIGGAIGSTAGTYAAKSVGAGPTWQELTGDVSGLLTGGLAAGGFNSLRGALGRLFYSGEVAADGTPQLSKIGKAIVHPTELPEAALRATIPPPDEAVAAAKAQAGELNAKDLEAKMAEVESARQKELAQWERLKNIDAAAKMARGRQQTALDLVEAKNAPKPSPFGENATSTSIASLKIPTPPKIETDSLGIRWAVSDDGLRVSVPRSVPDAKAADYATSKLQEQRQVLSDIKGRTSPNWNKQAGEDKPFTTTGPTPEFVKNYGDLTDLQGRPTSQDLVSRTKKLVQPGAPVTVEDLKRAGDLTQVPLEKLKQLASWGDELAKNEIVRRLRQ